MKRASAIKYVQVIILAVTVIAITLLAVLSTGIFGSPGNTDDAPPYSGTIRILTTPDIHSHLFPMSDNDTGTRIGRIGALADSLGEEEENTLYLFAGDLGEGSFYRRYAGVPEVTSYSMAGVDAAVPGNHAFDFSTGLFQKWAMNASYPIVCANLDFTDPALNDTVKDYTILDVGGGTGGGIRDHYPPTAGEDGHA
ncbi:metallophosphoesterase [Methanogenium cariaci]|uniref:metallophosphoesterase n=1 Tax=Methanogenium cariaci TaxID=2197 RepID=UPI001FDFF014|nr:metallophosphoesterase [Methanogenium cariaci]